MWSGWGKGREEEVVREGEREGVSREKRKGEGRWEKKGKGNEARQGKEKRRERKKLQTFCKYSFKIIQDWEQFHYLYIATFGTINLMFLPFPTTVGE